MFKSRLACFTRTIHYIEEPKWRVTGSPSHSYDGCQFGWMSGLIPMHQCMHSFKLSSVINFKQLYSSISNATAAMDATIDNYVVCQKRPKNSHKYRTKKGILGTYTKLSFTQCCLWLNITDVKGDIFMLTYFVIIRMYANLRSACVTVHTIKVNFCAVLIRLRNGHFFLFKFYIVI